MSRITILLLVSLISLSFGIAQAADVTLRWDPNDPTPDGYRIFVRDEGHQYDYNQPAWEGQATSATIHNLADSVVHHFVVRAFKGNITSADSNEVTFQGSGEVAVSPVKGFSIWSILLYILSQ